MRRYTFSAACIALFAVARLAGAAPATQPIAVAANVLVLPFSSVGEAPAPPWIAKAVQQNLLADFAHAHLLPIDQTQPAADAAAARDAGEKTRVRFVVFGTYQSVDQTLRFNGQILEVASGTVVGGFTETGSPRDLFALEDSMSDQAIHSLRQMIAPPMAPPQQMNPPAVAAANAPPAMDNRPLNIRPYEGSDLEAYLNSNRTPSTDYWDQFRQSNNRRAYQYDYTYGYYNYPYGYGPYGGYSSSFYPSYGYLGYGYGTPFSYVRARPGNPIYFGTDRTSH